MEEEVNEDGLTALVNKVEEGEPEPRWIGGVYGKWARPQYLALLEVCGTRERARNKADRFITWKKNLRPPDECLSLWEQEYDTGLAEPDPRDVARLKKRMIADEEWANREAIDRARTLKAKLADQFEKKIENGDQIGEDRVLWKYAADDIGFNTTATHGAYGQPKQQQIVAGNFIINAGTPPPKRLKSPRPKLIKMEQDKIIEAEVRELGSDGG